jgi:hypothetical protein
VTYCCIGKVGVEEEVEAEAEVEDEKYSFHMIIHGKEILMSR